MLTIYDNNDLQMLLNSNVDPDLKAILLHRVMLLQEYLETYAFEDLLAILVVQPGDKIEDIEAELTFSPLVCLDGYRFPDKRFKSGIWEFIIERRGYFEITLCLCDSGLGNLLILPDRPDIEPSLRALCRAYAVAE